MEAFVNEAVDIDELERRIGEREELLVRCTASWNSRLDEDLVQRLKEVRIKGSVVPAVRLDTDDPRGGKHFVDGGY
jgi:hypothetical protein